MKLKMILIARNIINQDVIKDFIAEVSEDQNDKIKSWCNSILKNYLKNEYLNIKDVTEIKKNDPEWLKLAVQNKDAQEIIITDEFKRNLLEHIFPYFKTLTGNIKHSFTEAENKTKEWDNRKSKFELKRIKGVKKFLKCEDGYTWFEIIDEETLYNEGEVLQNCLRENQSGEEYWDQIKNKEIKILTLRDSKGIGHVGVEYDIFDDFIGQMYGKQNKFPINTYHTFCIKLIEYLKCNINSNILKLLNVIKIKNKLYSIFNLPINLKTTGSLFLAKTKITKLPYNLSVFGKLDVSNTLITELPKKLKVRDDLDIMYTKISKLPEDLEVDGEIFINSDMKVSGKPELLRKVNSF